MTRSLRQRVLAGSGANAFGQAVTIGTQLLSLPLFLHYWDATTYGAWLILSAIPSYLSMADVGMVTAAGNKMTMAMGRQDVDSANKTFQSALVFMFFACGALFVLLVPASLWLPLPGLNSTFDYRLALAALSISVLFGLFGGLAEAVFKASNRYALGTFLSQLVRLSEWGGYMLGLYLVGSFSAVAIGGLIARALGLAVITVLSSRGGHGIRWSTKHVDRSEVKSLIKPAMSFMLFPLIFALSFQGVTLLVGQLLGSAAVAIFNTYRTLARIAVQLNGVFSHALWPEFARLYGAGGGKAVKEIYYRGAWSGLIFALLSCGILYFIAPWLLNFWTHGAIAFNSVLMLLMLGYAAISAAGHVPRTLLIATNEHHTLALSMLGSAIFLLLLSVAIAPHFGLPGIGFSMLLSELVVTSVCVLLGNNLIFDRKR